MKRKVVSENYLCFLALLEMAIENEQGVMITHMIWLKNLV